MATQTKPAVGDIIQLDETELAKIKLDHTKRPYAEGSSRAGQSYYIANYNGTGMAVEEGDYQLFKSGDMAELSLQFTEYERKDPTDPTKTVKRSGWRIISYITWTQLINVEGNKSKLAIIRKENELKLRKMEAEAMAEINNNAITEDMMAKLMQAAGASGAQAAKELITNP